MKAQKAHHKVYPLSLNIIHEDDHIAIVYKPAGIVVSANNYRNIRNALAHNLKPSKMDDALKSALPVHRLDKETQGLLLVAKTESCLSKLSQAFEQREIHKTYHAICHGKVLHIGKIIESIAEKESETQYQLEKCYNSLSYGLLSLVKLHPVTGRKHQLRIHLKNSKHSILGDPIYFGPHKRLYKKGLFLCSTGLAFTHPHSHEPQQFVIDIPPKFKRILESEARRWEKFNGEIK